MTAYACSATERDSQTSSESAVESESESESEIEGEGESERCKETERRIAAFESVERVGAESSHCRRERDSATASPRKEQAKRTKKSWIKERQRHHPPGKEKASKDHRCLPL